MNNKGFTLIELMAVFVVLGVLLGVTIPNIVGITTANKQQTYADDAKKFKNAVEYRFRGDSTIEKPTNNNDCIIANLKYVAGSEYDNPPYGGVYLMDYSYVIMAKKNNEYKYYVQLVEGIKPNPSGANDNAKYCQEEGCRGIKLDLITKLDGEKYQNEIDEATSISYFTPSLADIKTKTTEAQLTAYYATLANTIKDEDGNKVCNVVKRVYYEE